MITLKSNCNEIIRDEFAAPEFQSHYIGVRKYYEANDQHVFSILFQNLITKLGLIIEKAAVTKKYRADNYYPGMVKYLCEDVLSNNTMHNIFIAIQVNETGNKNKHTIERTKKIDIDTIISQYNLMIEKIVQLYNLKILNSIAIPKVKQSKVPGLGSKVYNEEVGGNLVTMQVSNGYDDEKNRKRVKVVLTLTPTKIKSGDTVTCLVTKNKQTAGSADLGAKNLNTKKEIPIYFSYKEIIAAKNVLTFETKLTVKRTTQIEHREMKGIIFRREIITYENKTKTINSPKRVFSLMAFIN